MTLLPLSLLVLVLVPYLQFPLHSDHWLHWFSAFRAIIVDESTTG